jgi:hypothetical protein
MDKEKSKQAIEICREAYATLEDAKSDCKDVVESAINALVGIDETTPKKIAKGERNEHKDDIKAIKKIAKALAQGKLFDVCAESSSLSDMVEELKLKDVA